MTGFSQGEEHHSVQINDESEGVILTRFLDSCFKPDMGMMAHVPVYAHDHAIIIPDHHAFNHRVERVVKKDESIEAFALNQMSKMSKYITTTGCGSAIRAFNDCWNEPVFLYKDKTDTMFSLKSKLMKFYKDHGLTIEQKKFNKEVQELNTHKKIMMFI